MIAKLRHWWHETRSSFWFVPTVIVLGAVGLATVLIALDATVELHVDKRWPLIVGSGASGACGLLSSVAGSTITVAGVVFSVSIVALSLRMLDFPGPLDRILHTESATASPGLCFSRGT